MKKSCSILGINDDMLAPCKAENYFLQGVVIKSIARLVYILDLIFYSKFSSDFVLIVTYDTIKRFWWNLYWECSNTYRIFLKIVGSESKDCGKQRWPNEFKGGLELVGYDVFFFINTYHHSSCILHNLLRKNKRSLGQKNANIHLIK